MRTEIQVTQRLSDVKLQTQVMSTMESAHTIRMICLVIVRRLALLFVVDSRVKTCRPPRVRPMLILHGYVLFPIWLACSHNMQEKING